MLLKTTSICGIFISSEIFFIRNCSGGNWSSQNELKSSFGVWFLIWGGSWGNYRTCTASLLPSWVGRRIWTENRLISRRTTSRKYWSKLKWKIFVEKALVFPVFNLFLKKVNSLKSFHGFPQDFFKPFMDNCEWFIHDSSMTHPWFSDITWSSQRSTS